MTGRNHLILKICLLILLIFISVGLLAFIHYEFVHAQGSEPSDDEVNQVASQLYCPICENVPLDECTTEVCKDWRDLIRQRLAEGWSQEEIKAYFVDYYGERVLGEPPKEGLHWLLYLLPPLIIIVGGFLLWNKFKQPGTPPSRTRDPYLERVEQDLEARNEK